MNLVGMSHLMWPCSSACTWASRRTLPSIRLQLWLRAYLRRLQVPLQGSRLWQLWQLSRQIWLLSASDIKQEILQGRMGAFQDSNRPCLSRTSADRGAVVLGCCDVLSGLFL